MPFGTTDLAGTFGIVQLFHFKAERLFDSDQLRIGAGSCHRDRSDSGHRLMSAPASIAWMGTAALPSA
jgi:hypothetical protein